MLRCIGDSCCSPCGILVLSCIICSSSCRTRCSNAACVLLSFLCLIQATENRRQVAHGVSPSQRIFLRRHLSHATITGFIRGDNVLVVLSLSARRRPTLCWCISGDVGDTSMISRTRAIAHIDPTIIRQDTTCIGRKGIKGYRAAFEENISEN